MILQKLKHLTRYATSSDYRDYYSCQKEIERIKSTPRYIHLSTNLLGDTLEVVDSASFYASYVEIFKRQIYSFSSTKKSPYIIDGGSNIGLSLIYLKRLYPESKILAFEADPTIFKILKANISNFGFKDIELINRALWNEETHLSFAVEGSDAGRVSRGDTEILPDKIEVPTVRLHDYIDQPVDFLKLDIEGAETEVIIDSSDRLINVENIFIEYHSFAGEEQRLDELLSTVKSSGFRVQIQTQFCSERPLFKRETHFGMDLQLNIFGYREKQLANY